MFLKAPSMAVKPANQVQLMALVIHGLESLSAELPYACSQGCRPLMARCFFAELRARLVPRTDPRPPAADIQVDSLTGPSTLASPCACTFAVSLNLPDAPQSVRLNHHKHTYPLRRLVVNCASQTTTIARTYDSSRCCTSLPPAHSTSADACCSRERPVPQQQKVKRIMVAHL